MTASIKFRGKTMTVGRAVRALQRAIASPFERQNSLRGAYATFAEAEQSAPRYKALGYDAANAAKWYQGKLEGVTLEDYPVLFWLRSAFETGRSVFEIGGHVGIAYYGFSKVLEYPQGLQWTICDVPTVAAAGEALARERQRTNLHFVTASSQCDGADIVLAAGALQYLDSPTLAETVAAFRMRPAHVLVNNTPVYDGPAYVTVQNLGGVCCAYRIFNRGELVASLADAGYELVDSWQRPRQVRIPGHPEKSLDYYSGFYFRAK